MNKGIVSLKYIAFLIIFAIFFLSPLEIFAAIISLDPSYGTGGKVVTSFGNEAFVSKMALQSDGKTIVVGGNYLNGTNLNSTMVRHNIDGSPDMNFGVNGKVVQDFGNDDFLQAITLQDDGKIVVGGSSKPTGNYQWTLARFFENGNLDSNFGNNGIVITFAGIHSVITSLLSQSDGKIIAVGYRASGGHDNLAVARYNSDGSLDGSFGNGGIVTAPIGGNNDRGKAAVLQPDGKIVILGDFDAGGHDEIFLTRYDSNGILDTSFGSQGLTITQMGESGGGSSIGLQADGKILIAGGTRNNGVMDTYVARYTSGGNLDATFGTGGKVIQSFSNGNDYATALKLQPDGKIILGGLEYSQASSGDDFVLRRFTTNGSLDTSFGNNGSLVTPIAAGSGHDGINDIILQNDGKIIAAGEVSNGSYNDWGLARYSEQVGGSTILPVPLLKQGILPYNDNNPSWEANEFDHANAGQFYCGSTMAQCGCATTSVAMVLKYYGVNTLPNGVSLDPGTLNTWLKNNNGYNRNLGIIWAVAATAANKAKSLNPNFHYDALEFDSNWTYSSNKLSNDLQQNIPNVLQENTLFGMHFIVANGVDANGKFIIKDPFYDRTSLTSYGNTAASVRRFVPANSDMSYISSAVDDGINISVKDDEGNPVGQTYMDFGPGNPTATSSSAQNSSLTIFEYAKPESGNYYVTLNSDVTKNFQFDITLITKQGDIKTKTIKGVVNPANPETFVLYFNKQSTGDSDIQKMVTFESTIEDIKMLRQLGLMHFSMALSTTAEIQNAAKLYEKGKNQQAEKVINAAGIVIGKSQPRMVDPVAKDTLLYDFSQLKLLLHK